MTPPNPLFQEQINKYVHGEDEPEYHLTMKAIRKAIMNCRSGVPFELLEGAIIFYKFHKHDEKGNIITKQDEKLYMKIFVLSEAQLKNTLYEQQDVVANPEEGENVLKRICSEKKYSTLNHYNLFKNKFYSWDHYILDLSKINEENEESQYEKRIFTPPQMKEALIIPIPVLSSPSILIYLNLDKLKQNFKIQNLKQFDDRDLKLYIREVQRRAAEVINFHITRRLHKEFLSNEDNFEAADPPLSDIPVARITKETTLIKKFANNLAHILLPIRYEITSRNEGFSANEKIIDWFDDQQRADSTFSINLLAGKYTMTYYLPTFWAPYSSHDFNGSYVHNGPEYEIRKLQLKDELERYFEHIYTLWNRIRDQNTLVKEAIKEKIQNSKFISQDKIDDIINAHENL